MKDFYDFLSRDYNFFGLIVLVSVFLGGITAIVNAATRNWGKNTAKSTPKSRKQKQQLND